MADTLNGSWIQRATEYLEDISLGQNNTAFGELATEQSKAFIQASAIYNLLPANFRSFTSGTGTTEVADKLFTCETGVGIGGYGAIQSFRSLNYKPGTGGKARFTAIFESNVANSWQGAGLLTIADELSFGYNGTSFGIWHRYGGIAEVRNIQITGGAGGSETLTLTLNDVAYSIPLTSGTEQHNAYEIENWLNNNQSIWYAQQTDDIVQVTSLSDGAKSGTYSFSSSSATATLSQLTAGATKTSDFINQQDWNGDFDNSNLNPALGNVYQIKYQYLGFGDIKFYIENPMSGLFENCHTIRYANSSTTPSVSNPSFKVGLYCVSLGSTTNLKVSSASMSAFIEGTDFKTRNPRAVNNTQIVSGDLTNILTIRNTRSYNGIVNQVEVEPLIVSLANESSKNAIIELRANATASGDTNFQNIGNNLVTDIDVTANTISGGRLLSSFTLGGGQSQEVDLSKLNIRIPPTLKFTIGGQVTSGPSASITATLVYYEDL